MDRELLAVRVTPWDERHRGRGGSRSGFTEVARKYGKTVQACQDRYNRLMRQHGHRGGQWTEEGLWTEAEDGAIRRAIEEAGVGPVPHGTWPDLARVLGRTLGAVRLRGWQLRRRLETAEPTTSGP